MQRRKFAVAMGALATGSGAVLTSGAFSQVESQRDVFVESVSDDEALLEFAPVNGDLLDSNDVAGSIESRAGFVNLTNNGEDDQAVAIDFRNMEGEDLPGNGLNNNSVTVIEDLFHILNAGATNIELSIHDAGLDLREDNDINGDNSLINLSDQPEGISFFVSNASTGTGANNVNDLGVDGVWMPTAAGETNWSTGEYESMAEYVANTSLTYNDIGAVTLGAAIDVGGVSTEINGNFEQSGENSEEITIIAQTTDGNSNFA